MAVHVRRGDYLLPRNAGSLGGVCTADYYRRAAAHILRHTGRPVFYVFSNDMEWTRRHLDLPGRCVYVDWNTGADSWQDMMLMSRCSHAILANSSFSWWAGYLNDNPAKIIVAPAVWIRGAATPDIAPPGWVRL